MPAAVDPDDPTFSLLEPGVHRQLFVSLGFFFLFVAFGVYVASTAWRQLGAR